MERVAAFDIETFCPIEELSQEDLVYLMGRKDTALSKEKLYRELFTNPYVSYLISFSFFFIGSNTAEVYYVCKEGKEEIKDHAIGNRVINVIYKPVVIDSNLLEAERMLLEHFWDRFSRIERLITFYGEDFDMEFIKIRTIMHGLKPKPFIDYLHSKYRHNIDLKELFKVGKNNYSLNFISRRLNLPVDKGDMDGSKIREAFLKERYKDIADYNLRDVIITALLYERVKDYIHGYEEGLLQLKDYMLRLLKSKNILDTEMFLDYILNKGLLTSEDASKLIDLYKLKQSKVLNQSEKNMATERQVNYIRNLAQKVELDMDEVCDQLSPSTIRQIIQFLEEEIT